MPVQSLSVIGGFFRARLPVRDAGDACIGAVIIVGAVLPFMFVKYQDGRFKAQIRGPWDEAVPKNSAAAKEWANAVL